VELVAEAYANAVVVDGCRGGAVNAGAKVAHYCVWFAREKSGL
jgi:glutamate synthase domain-containing protein 2